MAKDSSWAQPLPSLFADAGVDTRPVVSPSDETLVEQLCAGQMAALGQLFDRYFEMVAGIAHKILRDKQEALDLSQDIFLYVCRNPIKYNSDLGTVRAWLVRLSYHRSYDRRNYLRVRCYYSQPDVEVMERILRTASTSQHSDDLIDVERCLRIAEVRLTDKQRRTLRMYFLEGRTMHEIAVELGDTLSNVSHHYCRGLGRLRQALAGRRKKAPV